MELQDAEQALCKELNLDFADVITNGTNTLFSQADIDGYINSAAKRAWDYKPWTFTEGVVTLTAPGSPTASYDYPETFEDESIFVVIVNGVAWIGLGNGKRNFAEYMKWLSDYPTDTSLIYTEFARQYYLNRNAYSGGQSYSLYGKLRCPTLEDVDDLLPFSPDTDDDENSGNHAIILLAYADALASDKKGNTAGAKDQEARGMMLLDTVWEPMGERKAQKAAQHQPFFNGQDLFPSRRSTRFDTTPGNFP
ncbi:MAG TPA: hypothetical protein VGG72_21485 [Bryobacteraceae bacterium]|jgi:hypothetical protein